MSILYGDDPLSDGDADTFGRDRIVSRVVSSLNVLRTRTPSAVAALVGPWGSGKTTLLNQVEATLADGTEWRVAKYNPWSYSSIDLAVPAFFSEIRAALPNDESKGKETRAAIGGWISRLSPLGSIGGVVGADLSGAAQIVADLVAGDQSPEKLRSQAEDFLRKLNVPVLVLIDDLDRLGPDELLMTFKLVRLLGRLPNVYYLLSYDERTLQDILMKTGLVANEKSRAREYMEKMIQLRLDIPTMLPDDRTRLVNAVLQEVLTNHDLQLNEQDIKRLSRSWGKCVDRYVNQPRAAKRLFTQVDATWQDVAGEVDFVEFVLMTFIRTFEPSIYNLVEERSDELLSMGSGVWSFDQKESHNQRWERWLGYIKEAKPQHPESVAELLADLFIPLRSAKNNMEYGPASKTDIANRKGVGHPDYFYRYTQTGVPGTDIAESTILGCLRELRESHRGTATAAVEAKLIEDARLVVSKIMRHGSDTNLPIRELMQLLASNYEAIGAKEAGFLSRPSWPALELAEHLLMAVPADALSLIEASCQTASGLAFASDLMRQQIHLGSRGDTLTQRAGSLVANKIEAHLQGLDERTTDPEFEQALRNIWALRDLTSQEHARTFLWGLINSSSRWEVGDVLAAMLPVGTGSDGEKEWIGVGDFEAESIDSILGIEKVSAALGVDPSPPGPPAPMPRFDHHPTLDERRPIALDSLGRIIRSFRQQQN